MNRTVNMSRRQLLRYSAASAAGLLLPLQTEAGRVEDALAWLSGDIAVKKLLRIVMRLHPARFVAGLVIDIATEVLVSLVSDKVVSDLRKGDRSEIKALVLASTNGMETPEQFRHPNYKASLAVLGNVNVAPSANERQLSLLLEDEDQKKRFQKILTYLRSVEVRKDNPRLQLAGMSITKEVPESLEPDDLFSLSLLRFDKNAPLHYQQLINITDNSVFKNWSV